MWGEGPVPGRWTHRPLQYLFPTLRAREGEMSLGVSESQVERNQFLRSLFWPGRGKRGMSRLGLGLSSASCQVEESDAPSPRRRAHRGLTCPEVAWQGNGKAMAPTAAAQSLNFCRKLLPGTRGSSRALGVAEPQGSGPEGPVVSHGSHTAHGMGARYSGLLGI